MALIQIEELSVVFKDSEDSNSLNLEIEHVIGGSGNSSMESLNLIIELNTFANIIIHSRKQVLLL